MKKLGKIPKVKAVLNLFLHWFTCAYIHMLVVYVCLKDICIWFCLCVSWGLWYVCIITRIGSRPRASDEPDLWHLPRQEERDPRPRCNGHPAADPRSASAKEFSTTVSVYLCPASTMLDAKINQNRALVKCSTWQQEVRSPYVSHFSSFQSESLIISAVKSSHRTPPVFPWTLRVARGARGQRSMSKTRQMEHRGESRAPLSLRRKA